MHRKSVISLHLLLLAPILAAVASCGGESLRSREGAPVNTPESVGAVPLTSPDRFRPAHRAAAEAVTASIEAGGEDPGEFFAAVERQQGLLVFHLWHEAAFLPENQNMVGNPGGLCRDVHVDPRSMEIVATLWWQ